jgi:hypothetical protein
MILLNLILIIILLIIIVRIDYKNAQKYNFMHKTLDEHNKKWREIRENDHPVDI